MVPPRGIAPRSPAYRAGALLLSYGGWGKWWLFPVSRRTLPAFNGPLICLSYTAVDPPCGIAPQSAGYKAAALLLSYGGMENGRAPRCRHGCLPRSVPPRAPFGLPMAGYLAAPSPLGSSSQARRVAVFLARESLNHWKWMAVAGIEPAHGRRMRPLPFLLATPRLGNGGLCR